MAARTYAAELTLRQARDQYFQDNGFGADGGYGDAWVDFKLGPIPMPFPNTAGRVKAVRYHDLHHVVTGYATDTLGEFEISAWELASDCRRFPAGFLINLGGMIGGVVGAPARTWRAWVRGRQTKNLYPREFDEQLLETRVGETTAALRTDQAPRPGTALDLAVMALHLGLGLAVWAALLPLLLLLMPLGFIAIAAKRRAEARPG